MSSFKRQLIIVVIIVGTPILCSLIGSLGAAIYTPDDHSGLASLFAGLVGLAGLIGSLIFGPIVSFSMRKNQHQLYSIMGYLIPSGLALTYVAMISLVFPSGF